MTKMIRKTKIIKMTKMIKIVKMIKMIKMTKMINIQKMTYLEWFRRVWCSGGGWWVLRQGLACTDSEQ